MRVSARTEYACLAMLHLASRHGSDEPVRIRDIASVHEIPQRFLVQILLQLKSAGLVASTRGASGGYHLTRPPDEISLAEVMTVVDSTAEEPPTIGSRSASAGVLHDVWREAAEAQQAMLRGITLADLRDRIRGRAERMYYI
ncbi:MAG: Rrf2 family transcriptional regulator [Pirellulales bacterium]